MEWITTEKIVFGKKLLFLLESVTGETAIISGVAIQAGQYWDLIPDIKYDRCKWNCNKFANVSLQKNE